MDKNGFKQDSDTAITSAQSALSNDGGRRGSPAAEGQKDIHEEIRELRLEVERLRALQPTAKTDENGLGDEMDDEHGDDARPRDPAGRTRRRPLRLTLMAALA